MANVEFDRLDADRVGDDVADIGRVELGSKDCSVVAMVVVNVSVADFGGKDILVIAVDDDDDLSVLVKSRAELVIVVVIVVVIAGVLVDVAARASAAPSSIIALHAAGVISTSLVSLQAQSSSPKFPQSKLLRQIGAPLYCNSHSREAVTLNAAPINWFENTR